MASTTSLRSFEPERIAQPPECAACGERMHLAGVEPHNKFTRLDTHRYGCACGRTSEEAVPREA
ncbi:MAG TPA: hypothetical protein VK438_12070 [Xanthobacteraceae bacterium]|nr:hypothetical protein [Xanthobacteraceae bacterium]